LRAPAPPLARRPALRRARPIDIARAIAVARAEAAKADVEAMILDTKPV
jgi:hypothetical protein